MRPGTVSAILFLCCSLLSAEAFGAELKTQYTTLVYEKDELLRDFNHAVSLGSLNHLLRSRKSITADDEIKNKIDVLIERIQTVLDMRPRELKFRIVLLPTDTEVQKVYRSKYGTQADFIAFYSQREKTIYLSVSDIRLGVLAHELAHMIIDHYFGVPPPVKIHEVLAQFVEEHLKD